MELPFEKKVCRYYRQKRYELVNVEQTQELKLPEAMPDVERIVAVWGQVILRGKDWHPGSAQVNGGVMVWVLYSPEGDGPLQRLESWIPWKAGVDFPASEGDGVIRAECVLRSVDARNVSGRKLMLRAGVGVLTQVLCPESAELYLPQELPDDLERLEQTYPLVMTAEAGEKPFLVEEILNLPAGMPPVAQLVYYHMEPELLDQKVMGSKAVFRGVGNLHLLYLDDQGKLYGQDFEVPFAQYVDLDGEYEMDTQIMDLLGVTSLELEPQPEGTLQLKCGMVGQYIINTVMTAQVLEDAYSPCRDVELEYQTLELPVWVQQLQQNESLHDDMQIENGTVVDLSASIDAPTVTSRPGEDTIQCGCSFHALIQQEDGTCVGKTVKAASSTQWQTACDTICFSWLKGTASCRKTGQNWRMETQTALDLGALCRQELKMVTGITLGEERKPDPQRPSVIIRARGSDQSLWEMAKDCGSTVGAIRKLNQLEGEPESDQLLLIPVI